MGRLLPLSATSNIVSPTLDEIVAEAEEAERKRQRENRSPRPEPVVVAAPCMQTYQQVARSGPTSNVIPEASVKLWRKPKEPWQ